MHANYDDAPLGVEALTVFSMTAGDADAMRLPPGFRDATLGDFDEWDHSFEREQLRDLGRMLGFDC